MSAPSTSPNPPGVSANSVGTLLSLSNIPGVRQRVLLDAQIAARAAVDARRWTLQTSLTLRDLSGLNGVGPKSAPKILAYLNSLTREEDLTARLTQLSFEEYTVPVSRRHRPGYIYVAFVGRTNTDATDTTHIYKIGRTVSLSQRLSSLSASNPDFQFVLLCHVSDCVTAECLAHSLLRAFRLTGHTSSASELFVVHDVSVLYQRVFQAVTETDNLPLSSDDHPSPVDGPSDSADPPSPSEE